MFLVAEVSQTHTGLSSLRDFPGSTSLKINQDNGCDEGEIISIRMRVTECIIMYGELVKSLDSKNSFLPLCFPKEANIKHHKFTIYRREVTTTVIATQPELDQCLKGILSTFTPKFSTTKRVVGLAIGGKKFETIFNRGPKVRDRVAILKLCHSTTCLIIQFHDISSPPFSLLRVPSTC